MIIPCSFNGNMEAFADSLYEWTAAFLNAALFQNSL